MLMKQKRQNFQEGGHQTHFLFKVIFRFELAPAHWSSDCAEMWLSPSLIPLQLLTFIGLMYGDSP